MSIRHSAVLLIQRISRGIRARRQVLFFFLFLFLFNVFFFFPAHSSIARGIRARERASVDLGPRWEVEHLSPGAQLHGAISHPEFARALRAA